MIQTKKCVLKNGNKFNEKNRNEINRNMGKFSRLIIGMAMLFGGYFSLIFFLNSLFNSNGTKTCNARATEVSIVN